MSDLATIGFRADTTGIRQAEKGLDDLAKQGGRTESSLNNSSASISRGFSSVQSAVALVGTAITALTAGALSKYADTATSVENQLRAVTSSTTELADAQARLGAIANQTRSGYESTVELYSKLSRSTTELNISQERLYRITETINKSFASSGATAIEADNAIRQLAQGLASGALRGDEFNSVAEQAPEILRAVAKETGMTIGQLREFAAQGGITSELLIKSLENYQETVDRVYGKTSATISQSLTIANNNVIKYVENNEKLRSLAGVVGDAIIALSGKIDQMTAAASAVAAVVGVALVGSLLKSGAAFVSATAQSIAYQAALARMAGVSATAAAATTALGAATSFLLGPWGLLITALGAGAAAFAFAGDSAAEATGKMDEQAAAVSKLADKYTKLSSGNLAQTYADAQMQAIKLSERRLEIETRLTDLLGRSDGFAAQERNRLNAELRVTNEGLAKSELAIQAVNKVFEDGIPKADQMQTVTEKASVNMLDAAKAAKELAKQLEKVAKANEAWEVDEYDRITKALEDIEEASVKAAEAEMDRIDKAIEQIDKQVTMSEKAAERIEEAFANVWINAFDGMESMVDGMKNAFKRMLAEMAHMALTKPIMVSLGMGGMLPGGASAATAAAGKSDFDAVSAAGSLGAIGGISSGIISAGGAIGGAFGGGLAASGGLLANGSIGAMFSGAGSLFGSGNIMAGLGMSMPIIAGAVIAALGINKLTGGGLFGTSFKEKSQNLNISYGGGMADGSILTEEERKKSLFRGTKRRTTSTDFDTSALDDAFNAIENQIITASEALGLNGAKAILDGFTASARIDIKGLSESEINEKMQAWMGETADSMVLAVFGATLSEFQKQGEGYIDTLSRLAVNVSAVKNVTSALGLDFGLTGEAAIKAATNIIELAGGLDQLAALSSQYYQSFYSETERQLMLQQQLAEEFAKLNTAVPATRDEFRAMVDSLDLTTTAGQAQFAALMKLVPGMDQYLTAIEAQTAAAQQAADAATKEAEAKAAALKASQSSLELRLMDALGQSSEALAVRRQMELEATDASLHALLRSIYTAEDAAAAQRELASAQASAASSARSAAQDAFSKLKDTASAEKDRLKTELDLKLETIDKERSALESQRDSVIDGYNEQSRAVEQYVSRLEGLNGVINGFLASTGAAVDPFKRLTQIFNEAKAGLLPDQSELQSVLSGISSAGSSGFGSAFEQQRAMAIARSQASGIGGMVGGQLSGARSQLSLIQQQVTEASKYYDDQLAKLDTAAEQAQKLHDEQVGKIDAQLTEAEKQYNALMGIDDRVLTMEQALNEFNNALMATGEATLAVEIQQVEAINRVETAIVNMGAQLIEMSKPEDRIWLPPIEAPKPPFEGEPVTREMVDLLKELVAASDATAKHTKKAADELELTRFETLEP